MNSSEVHVDVVMISMAAICLLKIGQSNTFPKLSKTKELLCRNSRHKINQHYVQRYCNKCDLITIIPFSKVFVISITKNG